MKRGGRVALGALLVLLSVLPLGACIWQDDCGQWHCIGPVFPCVGDQPARAPHFDPMPDPAGACESECFRPRAQAGGIV